MRELTGSREGEKRDRKSFDILYRSGYLYRMEPMIRRQGFLQDSPVISNTPVFRVLVWRRIR